MSNLWNRAKELGFAIAWTIPFFATCATAQIIPDATLPNNSRVTTVNNTSTISGGTQAGKNLFHSFEQFSVPTANTAYFNNATDIQNIISRVTGKSISNIDGTLKSNGDANLFLINPNGIVFGPNASLNIGGSFIATTANSLNFADGSKFSATEPQTTPLLTVNVPVGLQFSATAAPIRNQSQASPNGATNIFRRSVGLQVQPNKTLALVGGDVTLEGGNLTAVGGRIELGSVAENSLVSINQIDSGWALGYGGVPDFQNIRLIQRPANGSQISSIVDTSGSLGGGSIQVQGNTVELIGNFARLINQTRGDRDGSDITIAAQKLILRDGAQIVTSTFGNGKGGNLIVNVSESVELIGSSPFANTNIYIFSALASATFGAGKAGDMTINARRLRVQDGARVSAESTGERIPNLNQFIPATGNGGNLTVNASESIELIGNTPDGKPSSLLASTLNSGSAGNLKLTTGKLLIRNQGLVSVSSQAPKNITYLGNPRNLGRAGDLEIQAGSIILDNQGKITAAADIGQGGNIRLLLQDLLLMRRNSQISTNAGLAQAGGDGGNITIYAPKGFIVANKRENSDISANAFTGAGGKVQINATGIFGIEPRSREDLVRLLGTNDPTQLDPQKLPTSDITAISQTNPTLNGVVNINTHNLEPNRGLIELTTQTDEPKLAQTCTAVTAKNQSSFVITGRGGLPSNPRKFFRSNTVNVDWVSLEGDAKYRQRANSVNPPTQIVEANRWIADTNGNVALVEDVSYPSGSSGFPHSHPQSTCK